MSFNPAHRVSERPVAELSLAQAMAERITLVKECTDIQLALGDRNRTDLNGNRIPERDYHEWRRRAAGALAVRQKRMQDLKERIRVLRADAAVHTSGLNDTSEHGLLKGCYELLRKLAREGVEFDPGEQALVDVVRSHLQDGAARPMPIQMPAPPPPARRREG